MIYRTQYASLHQVAWGRGSKAVWCCGESWYKTSGELASSPRSGANSLWGGCTSPPPEVLDVLLHKSRELEQIPAVLASCDSILPSRSQRKLFNFKGFYLNFQKSRIPQVPNGEAWCLPLLFFPMEYETFQPGHRWLGTHITLPSSLWFSWLVQLCDQNLKVGLAGLLPPAVTWEGSLLDIRLSVYKTAEQCLTETLQGREATTQTCIHEPFTLKYLEFCYFRTWAHPKKNMTIKKEKSQRSSKKRKRRLDYVNQRHKSRLVSHAGGTGWDLRHTTQTPEMKLRSCPWGSRRWIWEMRAHQHLSEIPYGECRLGGLGTKMSLASM